MSTTIFYNDLDKVCRGCLGKSGEMRPLFGTFLDKMLRTVAEVEVQVGDGLPELMCVPCVLQVSRAFTFKQVCQRSDTTLRLFYREIEKSLNNNKDANVVDVNPPVAIVNTHDNLQVDTDALASTAGTDLQSQTLEFPDATDSDNIDKCLLIVHGVSQSMSSNDDLSSQIAVANEMIAADENHFMSMAEQLNENDIVEATEQHIPKTENDDDSIDIVQTVEDAIKMDVLSLDADDIQTDLITDHFGESTERCLSSKGTHGECSFFQKIIRGMTAKPPSEMAQRQCWKSVQATKLS